MSAILNLADAIVAGLNGHDFSQGFTATREYVPSSDLPALASISVVVVPKAVVIESVTREAESFDCDVDIGIQRKMDISSNVMLDAMVDLTEEIVDFLRMSRLADYPTAGWLSIANEPVFAVEHLDQEHVFTSIVTVKYRILRTKE